MGKKKVPSIEDELKIFNDIFERLSLSDVYKYDNMILGKDKNNNTIIINMDNLLWDEFIKDKEIEDYLEELRIYFEKYFNNINNKWVEIPIEEDLYTGNVYKIKIYTSDDDFYEISISRDSMPIKLKKVEYKDTFYRIDSINKVLSIKKEFKSTLENYGFSLIRFFKIL